MVLPEIYYRKKHLSKKGKLRHFYRDLYRTKGVNKDSLKLSRLIHFREWI